MTVRINARVDAKLVERVSAIQRRTGKSLTQVIEESLQQYCERQSETDAAALLMASGFVACASGPKTLSADYKARLRRGWERKA